MVVVQPLRELLQHGIQRIGSDALDNQLPTRHADRQRIALTNEETAYAVSDAVDSYVEQGMAGGIDGVLVQRNRQLDQKIRELTRQRDRRFGTGGSARWGSGC